MQNNGTGNNRNSAVSDKSCSASSMILRCSAPASAVCSGPETCSAPASAVCSGPETCSAPASAVCSEAESGSGVLRIFQKGFNFSQDGPGNRLVYHLQGCNLRCPWCSNPEGLELQGGSGKDYTVVEILTEVQRSRMMFFDGGGVTLTGGEVTLQLEAVKELFRSLREAGVNTCIETNGTNPRLPELFPVLNHLIMDVKHYSPEIHRTVTGLPNEAVFRNVAAAVTAGMKPALRIPLIGGFNAAPEDAEGFAELFLRLGVTADNATLELLRYHEYGKDKYRQLGMTYTMDGTARVSAETLQLFTDTLRNAGITVIRT